MSWFPKDIFSIFSENDFLDDGTDRAHRIYFPLFLLASCTVLGIKQFAGDPIDCYTDVSQKDYVDNYCWTASTYQLLKTDYDVFRLPVNTDVYLPGKEHLLTDRTFSNSAAADSILDGEKVFVSYYQWVPILVAIQAVLFHAPYVVWWTFSKRGGLHLPHLMYGSYCLAKVQTNPIARDTQKKDAAYLLDLYFQDNLRAPAPRGLRRIIPRKMHLTLLYFFVKLLYIANVIFQLGCLHSFLQVNILSYALDVVKTVIFGQKWLMSPRFPIRTLCEFRGSPQVHGYLLPHTCHCVLPINLYNDKFYAVMVIMMLILLLGTFFSIFVWAGRLFYKGTANSLIKELVTEKDESYVNGFINQYLRSDGLFVLNLIYKNVGSGTGKEIASSLYEKYKAAMACDSSSEDSIEKQPMLPSPKPAINNKQLRCNNCGNPWSAKDEGKTCSKCKSILKSMTPV